MKTPAEIASSLTKARREFLLLLPADGSWRRTQEFEINRHGPNALRGFGQSGLIEGSYRTTTCHRLTHLGQQVRETLLSGDTKHG